MTWSRKLIILFSIFMILVMFVVGDFDPNYLKHVLVQIGFSFKLVLIKVSTHKMVIKRTIEINLNVFFQHFNSFWFTFPFTLLFDPKLLLVLFYCFIIYDQNHVSFIQSALTLLQFNIHVCEFSAIHQLNLMPTTSIAWLIGWCFLFE
jgi:hypothetical protein